MNTYRKTAVLVGVLFIIGTVAGVLSLLFTTPVFNEPGMLDRILANPNQVSWGALCVLAMGLALAMVPVIAYPVLKTVNQPLAVGYIVFRGGLETMLSIFVAICWLLLAAVSQAYSNAGAVEAASLTTQGATIKAAADTGGTLMAVIFPAGALMFYALLYRSRLVPRWLSLWGFIAILLHLVSTGLLPMFNLLDSLSPMQIAANLPIFVQEMVMAVWLIAKGFRFEETRIRSEIQMALR